jgi:hypothetical protein
MVFDVSWTGVALDEPPVEVTSAEMGFALFSERLTAIRAYQFSWLTSLSAAGLRAADWGSNLRQQLGDTAIHDPQSYKEPSRRAVALDWCDPAIQLPNHIHSGLPTLALALFSSSCCFCAGLGRFVRDDVSTTPFTIRHTTFLPQSLWCHVYSAGTLACLPFSSRGDVLLLVSWRHASGFSLNQVLQDFVGSLRLRSVLVLAASQPFNHTGPVALCSFVFILTS